MTFGQNVKRVSDVIHRPRFKSVVLGGLPCSSATAMFASLASKDKDMPSCLFILNDEDEAGYFYNDLVQMMSEEAVLYFPSSYRRAIKYNQKDQANEILRTDVLSKLEKGGMTFVVTYPDALAEKVMSKRELDANTLNIAVGETHDFTELEQWMDNHGFIHCDYVYEPGQYAIRGSIFDVYSFASEDPFRIDFFGDEVDSIRTFDIQTQLSVKLCDAIKIVPELSDNEDEYVSFAEFIPDDMIIVTKNIKYVYERIQRIYEEGFAQQAHIESTAINQNDQTEKLGKLFRRMVVEPEKFQKDMDSRKIVTISPSKRNPETITGSTSVYVDFNVSPQPLFHKQFQLFKDECKSLQQKDYQIYVLSDNPKQIERLWDIMSADDEGIDILAAMDSVTCILHEGFVDHDSKIALLTDHQIFDRFHKYNLRSSKARSGKVALTLKEIQQFEVGDYVVHIDHGVGRFAGLIRVPIDGVMQEMIKITYQNNDFVYVSIHSLHKVSKYKGREGEPPRINRLGTGAWEKMKDRVKTKVKDIARDLIKLYARRMQEKGYAYSHDTYLQHELEASFAYEDTPDQLKATQDVKHDMESQQPMDRLICGDVGFGKTEIAVRAAFKAATDGKQVAVLVPTTVLAYQHFITFSQRLKDFPVNVEYLSRARTAKEQKQILDDLKNGKIEIIIGTHKLIGKDVKFKDLGLLVIDEEQKFGVGVKEKLRQMRVNVDTLTMTATPIPRTLQFSLMGARDLSVISTPPPNRHPIQTEIHTLTPEIVAEAINFELSRNGQVFFVNNKISNLGELKNMINRHVPDARVCIGHGRMDPKELEQIVLDFINHDYDVLLSTTIIENGIDVPNANTIIINSAHNYGLSDLHQMRGRVGRSDKKAFCYLLAPPLAALPDQSRRRLMAVENFSELGSGLNIAMQDLDIRGAGNMLGAEQSGFIADLGYETYQKVLSEAVAELKAMEFSDLWANETEDKEQEKQNARIDFDIDFVSECNIETDIPASFDELYIPSSGERMALYRELDQINSDAELEKYKSRLIDRFGPVPEKGEELIRIMPLKRLACKLGIERIFLKKHSMTCYLVEDHQSPYYQSTAFGKLLNFATRFPRRCKLIEAAKRAIRIDNVNTVKEALQILENITYQKL